MKIENIMNAVISEKSLIRSMGSTAYFFTIEVHLSRSSIEYLRSTAYVNLPMNKDEFLTFMGCPVIEDSTDFVCTIHKVDISEEENRN